ncbi:MAG TPA: dihydrolipoyl dehydrogenase [Alphaproteobacteria bacterium]|jgi:dihydrolipoamide dehydrogenase|uniref:dihydrolipoyl dehydrogenase n=1 Tax=Marinobacter alexandrii TaxID=2570351 RepID=UPI001109DB2E|nr:dihydrolipoyl dehydrogenase [Marinobacter alexandrii]HIO00716.1 dihydrolipoyl dehydrogenase [Alphaproteobacteria bacterium]
MSEVIKTKVLVVGGGPGGYVAAIRCGQLGLDTVLVEGDQLGGTCLIRGCIPSKAMIHAASEFSSMVETARKPQFGISLTSPPELDLAGTVAWKDSIVNRLNTGVGALLKRAKVKVIEGWGRFSDAKTCQVETSDGTVTIQSEHVILATGSAPVELPFLPMGGKVISSAEALSLAELPRKLVVVGAGYIGLELGIAYAKLGSDVTVVESTDRILPLYDKQLVEPVRQWLEKHGVKLHLNACAKGERDDGLAVELDDGSEVVLPADNILVTVGRKPLTEGWGMENMVLEMDGRFVKVDEQCATSTKNVWAIGDLVGEPMLAHKASAQGEVVAEIIAGKKRRFDPVAIPAVCFTEPEIVSVGVDAGAPNTTTGVFPMAASGRALSMNAGDSGGFVRVVAHSGTHRILGVQAVGAHISELTAAFTTAIEMGATVGDIESIIQAHPTMGEMFQEASLKVLGHAIHA